MNGVVCVNMIGFVNLKSEGVSERGSQTLSCLKEGQCTQFFTLSFNDIIHRLNRVV
jgi:hypothetical protein